MTDSQKRTWLKRHGPQAGHGETIEWSNQPICLLPFYSQFKLVDAFCVQLFSMKNPTDQNKTIPIMKMLSHSVFSVGTCSVYYSAANRSIGSTAGCTITEKAPTRAFSWLKAPTSAFTFQTLLRHYAKRALTPW